MPTVVGRLKYRKSSLVEAGNAVKSPLHTISRPINDGTITNWDDMEILWDHLFNSELGVDPSNHPVLLTEHVQNLKTDRERTVLIMFERFNVPGLYLASQPTLSLYASGKITGLVVHSGHSQTVAQPVCDGYPCWKPIFTRVDGATVNNFLCRALWLERQLTMDKHPEIVSDIKEKHGYIALDYDQEQRKNSSQIEKSYELPDGNVITVGREMFQCPEVLFNPFLWTDVNPLERPDLGIHELVLKAFINIDVKVQREVISNVVLSGGNTKFPGIAERLTKEVVAIDPSVRKKGFTEVISLPQRDLLPWMGGSILSSVSTFQSDWISKAEYDESGPSIVHRKCIL